MTCSTKILTLAIALVLLISAGVICDTPLLPGGTVKFRYRPAHSSKRLNTLSAIILLYLGNISNKPDFRVISLSLILPVYAFDTNVIAEFGATQTKNLGVLWCFYSDQVALCSSNFFGVSINISEQSIIPIKFLKCLYLFGVVASIVSISGIKTNDRKYSAIFLIHEWNILVQRIFDIPNRWATSLPRRPNLNFIRASKNSSFDSSLVSGPNFFGVLFNCLVSVFGIIKTSPNELCNLSM